MPRIAIIGMGLRITGVFELLQAADREARLVAIVDPNRQGVLKVLEEKKIPAEAIRFYDTVDELLVHRKDFDAVMVGTRCHMHTPIAIKLADSGLPLFLEKPVAITPEQYEALKNAYVGREDNVVVSFPLRNTPLVRTTMEIIQTGRLGTINQVQAINNVPYGGVYFGYWYRNYDEVGGLWLQKATHDFDYINLLVGSAPRMISAMTSQKIYGGQMPHDLKCSACDQTETCIESPQNARKRDDDGGMGGLERLGDHWCPFSREIRNEDSGSAIIMYDNGVHASYSQNFISRRSAGLRGATITGHKATLRFAWNNETITVIDHHSNRVDTIVVKATGGHEGGDGALVDNFLNLIKGKERSRTSLKEGLLSAAMCLAARTSAETKTFQSIPQL